MVQQTGKQEKQDPSRTLKAVKLNFFFLFKYILLQINVLILIPFSDMIVYILKIVLNYFNFEIMSKDVLCPKYI